jgi:1-deoxy-D-xylulose 5-phosphate reductoisomerase
MVGTGNSFFSRVFAKSSGTGFQLGIQKGGTAPAVMNGANEVAVDSFLTGAIKYLEIIPLVSRIVELHLATDYMSDDRLTIEEVTKAANWAKDACQFEINR